MKYISFQTKDGTELPGVLKADGKIIALRSLPLNLEAIPGTLLEFIQTTAKMNPEDVSTTKKTIIEAISHIEKYESYSLEEVELLAPIPYPVHDIVCVGVNYSDHLAETQAHMKGTQDLSMENAVYFSKRANRILGPKDDIPARLDLDTALDYEVELAVVIGKEAKDIKCDDVEDYIFGYSVFNDVSSRMIQSAHGGQWYLGKSLDGYAVMGPSIVDCEELSLPFSMEVKSYVNGELRQNSNTRMLMYSVAELVSELSSHFTLVPGDIIATGTPSGVGMGYTPPKYMKDHDFVVCEIESIGRLENRVKCRKEN